MRIIANEKDYQEFIQVGYDKGCVIHIYVDHLGVCAHRWIMNDQAKVCSPEDKLMTCKVMYMMTLDMLIPLL